jgi:hypothetical protein
MRYAPPGLCVNDFALMSDDGVYTVLHLQGPWTDRFDHLHMETSYGRAVSTDLVAWEPQGTAFGVGLPGRFDQQAVWTMHPVPYGDGLAMFYTGVQALTAGGWPLQAVGMAVSDRRDGTAWRRRGTGPVVRADPRWYRTGESMGWRDPFVVRDDEGTGWAMVVCASDASLPVEISGCVGLATSPDLTHWQVHPPLLSPGDIDQLECPVLERTADGWLLLGGLGSADRFDAWSAPRLRGPWEYLGPVGPPGAYAPRVIVAPDGARVVLHTAPRRVGLRDSGDFCRGMLAQPKVLTVVPGGAAGARARLEWWNGLDAWLEQPTDGPVPHAVGDVDITGPAELVLRKDNGSPALAVRCDATHVRVTGPGGSLLQEAALAQPVRRLRVLTIGEYVEVYADGVFILMTPCYSGRPVPWTATAEGRARPVPVRPVRLPAPYRDDASAIWPGPTT